MVREFVGEVELLGPAARHKQSSLVLRYRSVRSLERRLETKTEINRRSQYLSSLFPTSILSQCLGHLQQCSPIIRREHGSTHCVRCSPRRKFLSKRTKAHDQLSLCFFSRPFDRYRAYLETPLISDSSDRTDAPRSKEGFAIYLFLRSRPERASRSNRGNKYREVRSFKTRPN